MSSSHDKEFYKNKIEKTAEFLKGKKKVLFLTTSNRWAGEKKDIPKSTLLARRIAELLDEGIVEIVDVPTLKIYPCEGNVSTGEGNTCGVLSAKLLDPEKNPSGCHRCFASVNNPDDELWKISKPLLEADAVVLFGSVRWGQMNAFYQKLIERLTWLENRHSTLGEDNILEKISAGIIVTGQNWNGENVVTIQKQVLGFFGFQVVDDLCWNWQYTEDFSDESEESYENATKEFEGLW